MNKTATPDFMKLPIDSAELLQFAEDNASQEPSDLLIASLLRYSKSFEVRSSELLGKIETVYN